MASRRKTAVYRASKKIWQKLPDDSVGFEDAQCRPVSQLLLELQDQAQFELVFEGVPLEYNYNYK